MTLTIRLPLLLLLLQAFLGSGAQAQVVINEIFYAPQDKTKPLEFIEFPDVGHNIEDTDDRVRLLGAVDVFLKTNNPAD